MEISKSLQTWRACLCQLGGQAINSISLVFMWIMQQSFVSIYELSNFAALNLRSFLLRLFWLILYWFVVFTMETRGWLCLQFALMEGLPKCRGDSVRAWVGSFRVESSKRYSLNLVCLCTQAALPISIAGHILFHSTNELSSVKPAKGVDPSRIHWLKSLWLF